MDVANGCGKWMWQMDVANGCGKWMWQMLEKVNGERIKWQMWYMVYVTKGGCDKCWIWRKADVNKL